MEEKFEKFDEMVKKESKEPRGEIHCPDCGSSRLYYFVGGRAGTIYVCKNCGYTGPFVIEDGEIAAEIQKNWKREQNRTG